MIDAQIQRTDSRRKMKIQSIAQLKSIMQELIENTESESQMAEKGTLKVCPMCHDNMLVIRKEESNLKGFWYICPDNENCDYCQYFEISTPITHTELQGIKFWDNNDVYYTVNWNESQFRHIP